MTDEARSTPPAGWPDPNERDCDDCGHVWFAGERRHAYATFDAPSAAEADVVCVLCRRQRERPRDDSVRWSGWEPKTP